jgi:PIN like domain
MASLRDQFQEYYAPDDDAIKTVIQSGLVTPDTNVLLRLYRFQTTAREQLFGILEKLGDRLWIPHQVGLEFHNNRLGVIAEQEEYFEKVGELITARLNDYLGAVKSFTKRIGLPTPKMLELEEGIRQAHSAVIIGDFWHPSERNGVRLDDHASDEVLARIDALFENRVGEPMTDGELEKARVEAKRRGDAGIPPGYKDKGKDKGDPAGDYLVWMQLKRHAKERKLSVALITDDTKEDWYQKFNGRTLGARYELRKEMMVDAGVQLLVMTTETFLLHAEKYLNAEVSEETIAQAKVLSDIDEARRKARETWLLKSAEALRERINDPNFLKSVPQDIQPDENVVEQVIELGLLLPKDEALDNTLAELPPEKAGQADAIALMLNSITDGLKKGELSRDLALYTLSVIRDLLLSNQESSGGVPAKN